jgi:hypothetical protein
MARWTDRFSTTRNLKHLFDFKLGEMNRRVPNFPNCTDCNNFGGFKSEVQHLPTGKVHRCTTAPRSTSNSNLKTV